MTYSFSAQDYQQKLIITKTLGDCSLNEDVKKSKIPIYF